MKRLLAEAERICLVPAPTFAEGERAALVRELFAAAGAPAEVDEVGNVVCRLEPPSGDDAEAAAVFAAHLDTVFPAEQPLAVRREGDRLVGPGIGDNSLGVAALLELARRLVAEPVGRPVVLAATVGEEGLGDLRGAKHLVATVPAAAFVAVEGQMLDSIKTGGIGSLRYRIAHRGPGGHPWGDRGAPSAVHGLVSVAAAFLEEVRSPELVANLGRISGGTSINTVAAEAVAELDLRSEQAATLAAAGRLAEERFGAAPPGLEAEVERVGDRPSGALPAEHPLLEAARRAREAAGLPPAGEGASSTDANAAHGAGIPAVTVGVSTGGNAHRPDDYVDVAPIASGMRALEVLARDDSWGAPS